MESHGFNRVDPGHLARVTNVESSTWLAWAAWAAIVLGIIALVVINHQLGRSRQLAAEQSRPHVGVLMEPHAADWHVIELVVRNFGKTAAYNVRFSFPNPPTVAEYENSSDGYAEVVELQLPSEIPVLAPGQEWRLVWDSALDRAEIGGGIESRFTGTVTYFDRPDAPRAGGSGSANVRSCKPTSSWTGTPCRPFSESN